MPALKIQKNHQATNQDSPSRPMLSTQRRWSLTEEAVEGDKVVHRLSMFMVYGSLIREIAAILHLKSYFPKRNKRHYQSGWPNE